MADSAVKYLVFDIESVADGELVSKVHYPGEGLSSEQAIARYRAELLEQQGSDFIPYTYQLPAAIVVAKVAADYELVDLVALDEPEYRPHVMVSKFWKGWDLYHHPTLVSFNGRTFDIPLLELAAFRFGLDLRRWFDTTAKNWDQPRNRYNLNSHYDLQEVLTNMGATRFSGGLNLAANLLGRPGKMDISGYMVQDLFDAGGIGEITDYCRCDVLDTYFVFLRTQVVLGKLTLDSEQERIERAMAWIEARVDEVPIFGAYLANCVCWSNPWLSEASDDAGRRVNEAIR